MDIRDTSTHKLNAFGLVTSQDTPLKLQGHQGSLFTNLATTGLLHQLRSTRFRQSIAPLRVLLGLPPTARLTPGGDDYSTTACPPLRRRQHHGDLHRGAFPTLTLPPGPPPLVHRMLASFRPQLPRTRLLLFRALAPLQTTETAVKIALRAKLYLVRMILRMITLRFHPHRLRLRQDFAPLTGLRV